MKLVQIIPLISLILIGKISFSQTKVKLHFEDNCQKVRYLEYNLCNLNDNNDCLKNLEYYKQDTLITIKPGVYYIDVYFIDGKNEEFTKSFNLTREFKENKTYMDTIRIPEILRKTTRVLHYPKDLGFFKCDSICHGEVIEYHENGKMKTKGVYKNGRPIKKVFYYSKQGELIETRIYDNNGYYKKSKYSNYEKFLKDY